MAQKPSSRGASNSDAKLVRELAEILNETDLSEIEMKKGELKIRVSRKGPDMPSMPMVMQAPAASAAPMASAPAAPAPTSKEITQSESESEDFSAHTGAVKSPMVGTVYVRPSPDADPFKSEGDTVKEGDTVLLVEAMKTFNPITAPKSGKITHILVEDAQPVEFGEVLFVID